MHFKLIRFGLVLLLFIVLLQTQVIEALFSLLFIGIIPGTGLVIPASVMLLAYAALGYVVIYWIIKNQYQAAPTSPKSTAALRAPNKSITVSKRKVSAKKSTKR